MPKTLLLLRHAKSSWDDPATPDFGRPLNKRGRRDAPRVGQLLGETRRVPEVIYCSSAQRAQETAQMVIEPAGYAGQVDYRSSLYLAAPDAYVAVLSETDPAVQRVLAIGHNPGLEQLVAVLTGVSTTMPTAALAEIELDIEHWSDLRLLRCGTLKDLWRPKHE